jgi:tetratricopeptide (TPR) repeat protein
VRGRFFFVRPDRPQMPIHRFTRLPHRRALRLLALIAASFAIASTRLPAQRGGAAADRHTHSAAEKLGAVSFPNSGNAAAQPDFLRGLALLHNFDYADASRAFRSAQQRDPSLAIAYWLDALTFSHMLWSEEDLSAARATLARLGSDRTARLAKAKTPRERAYGAAIEAFFVDTTEATRTRAFADSMRSVAAAYPTDLEAQAFAALATMLAAEHAGTFGEENRLYLVAASYADRVFRAQPNHPGAAHYLIHAYDDPSRAAKGLDAARAYARIAPSSEHAQHMPSHIFVQLGYWDDAAKSNEQAWAASRAHVAAQHDQPTELDFHALNWLTYAYLQQGRNRAAHALIDSARLSLARASSPAGIDQPDAHFAVSQLQFKYMRETGDWKAWAAAPFDTSELHLPPTATQRAQSMAIGHVLETAIIHVMRGDSTPVSILSRRMRDQIAKRGGAVPASDRARAAIFDALILRARGSTDAAISILSKNETAVDSVPPIGPVSLLPLHELLGAMLFDVGRYSDAAAAYRRALVYAPNRSGALLGVAMSEFRAKRLAASDSAVTRLLTNWSHADRQVLTQIPTTRP